MSDNISVYIDALDNDAKFRLIDLNEKAHTVPKTAKEKELAAMGHPKDKITHKDILIGRGVLSKEEAERIAEKATEGTHYCAKHVFSERFGEGVVVEGAHAEPDENGLIEWYDVDFGGTVRRVMTEKVKVMHAEYHMNHKRKMKEEDEIEEMSSKEKMKRGLYNKEEAGKEHTVPKTAKEKKLAAMGHPKDKITHKDILIGRGVLSKEEVELEEAKTIKAGDFVKNVLDGKVHRVFDVRGNILHTGEYRGKDAYGGDSILHKTKAVKVPRPADVTEEVEQIDELSSGTIDRYRKKLGTTLDTKPAYTTAAKTAQKERNAPIRDKIHNALMKQHQAIRRERGMSEPAKKLPEEVELDEVMHSPFRKAALALRNKSFDPKNSSDDRAAYSLHADLLASKDPKHHEASAKMMSGHDTYMRDQISDAVHQSSSKENSAKYHKMGGVKRLK